VTRLCIGLPSIIGSHSNVDGQFIVVRSQRATRHARSPTRQAQQCPAVLRLLLVRRAGEARRVWTGRAGFALGVWRPHIPALCDQRNAHIFLQSSAALPLFAGTVREEADCRDFLLRCLLYLALSAFFWSSTQEQHAQMDKTFYPTQGHACLQARRHPTNMAVGGVKWSFS